MCPNTFRTRKSSKAQPRSLKASKKVKEELYPIVINNLASQEAGMTRVLIIIVILFIICQSIKLIPDFYEVYKCYDSKM
jgi:hypothetical protein